MTLLPASCGEAGVFITTTGAEGRAALRGPAPRSHPHGAGVPRWQSWLMLRVPVGLQVHMSLTPWAKVSLPQAGPRMATLQSYPHYIFQGIFGASRASPAPPAASDLLAGVRGSWQGKRRRCRASPFLLLPLEVRVPWGVSTKQHYRPHALPFNRFQTNSGSSGSIHHC